VGRRHIREILARLKTLGRTIFINSHLLGEVELICDRVGILQRGEMIREGSIAELTRTRGTFVVGLAPGQTFPHADAAKLGYEVRPSGLLWEVQLADGQTIDPLIDWLGRHGLNLRHLVEKRQSLEDLFLETVGNDEAPARRVVSPPPVS
jgi:ABC-2 type transport system ATP-binding protein